MYLNLLLPNIDAVPCSRSNKPESISHHYKRFPKTYRTCLSVCFFLLEDRFRIKMCVGVQDNALRSSWSWPNDCIEMRQGDSNRKNGCTVLPKKFWRNTSRFQDNPVHQLKIVLYLNVNLCIRRRKVRSRKSMLDNFGTVSLFDVHIRESVPKVDRACFSFSMYLCLYPYILIRIACTYVGTCVGRGHSAYSDTFDTWCTSKAWSRCQSLLE